MYLVVRSLLSNAKVSLSLPCSTSSEELDTYSNPGGSVSTNRAKVKPEAVMVTVSVPPGATAVGETCLVALRDCCACTDNALRLSIPTAATAAATATNASILLNNAFVSIAFVIARVLRPPID